MKEEVHGSYRERRHRHGKEHGHKQGAKTFRRGRAITFLERMDQRRSVLKKQLETPELKSIHPVLVGELKAIDMVIGEFVHVFELYEYQHGPLPDVTEEKEDK